VVFHRYTRQSSIFFLFIVLLNGAFSTGKGRAREQAESLIIPTAKRDSLLNGLQLLTFEKPGSGSINLKVNIRSGAMFDLVGKGGLADLTAAMVLRGGGGYTSASVEETLKQFGLKITYKVNWDATDFEITGPTEAVNEMFDLSGRLILSPTFDQKEFEALKEKHLSALKEKSEEDRLSRRAMDGIFGTHPYGKPIRGTSESVQQISKFDLNYYHKKFYLANNSMVVVTGDITAEEVTKLARTKFGAWRKGEVAPASFQPPSPLSSRRVIVIDKPDSQTAQAVIVQTGFSRRSADYLAALVMSKILNKQVEKRFGQAATFQVDPRLLNGPITIEIKSPAADLVNQIDKALLILTEWQTVAPSAEDVESAKAEVIATMAERLRNHPGEVFFAIDLYGLGKDYLVTFTERVNGLTPADIQKAAQSYLRPKNNVIVIAAPAKGYESDWKKLGDVIVTP
jgi:zinc protease